VTVAEVAGTLGLSATPVREAIRLLQAEGLLESRPHFAAVVKEFSLDRIAEVYRLRCQLEPLAARLAAEHATLADIAEIERAHKAYVKAAAIGAHEAIALNAAWHRAVAKASASPLLEDFINRLWSMLINQGLWATGHAERSAAQHETVMSAIKQKDQDAAAAAMSRHCESGASFTEGLRGDRDPSL
jgi:DNA-binding GntR family transcriptional regulator